MKIDNSGYMIKGILLTVCGISFTFFPNVLAWVFYIIGGIIIVGSALTFLGGIGDDGLALLPAGGIGIMIGLFIMSLPKLISSHLSFIAGLILVVVAIVQMVKSNSKKLEGGLKTTQLIFGIVLLVAALFFMFSPFKTDKIVRIIVGVVLMLFAAFNFYVVHVINERNGKGGSNASNVIDTSGQEKPPVSIENNSTPKE